MKNTGFRDGLAFEIDYDRVISPGFPKVILPQSGPGGQHERFGPPKTRAVLSLDVISKVGQAIRGGTDEKLEILAKKETGRSDEEESDSGSE